MKATPFMALSSDNSLILKLFAGYLCTALLMT
jgi:hypothetical protein